MAVALTRRLEGQVKVKVTWFLVKCAAEAVCCGCRRGTARRTRPLRFL